jgi:hypothetical protein
MLASWAMVLLMAACDGESVTLPAGADGGYISAAASSNGGGPPPPLSTVRPEEGVLNIGDTLRLYAYDTLGNRLDPNWSTSDKAIATVSSSGLVTAVAEGSATITARARSVTASASIDVLPIAAKIGPGEGEQPAPAKVEVTPTPTSLEVGKSAQLTATVKDAAGTTLTGQSVTWSSSNTKTATIDAQGKVTGVAAGTATITADVNGVKGTGAVTVTEPASSPSPSPSAGQGIWISKAELDALPTSGAAWDRLLSDAGRDPGTANIADQDSRHDIYTLAAALVCVRTNQHCAKARKGVLDAIGTEYNQQPSGNGPAAWLEVGRNLAAYVIAADLLGLRADGNSSSDGTRVEQWIASWLTKEIPDNSTGKPRTFIPFSSGSNAAAQEGFAYTAVAAYLGNRQALDRAWDAFRTYACDPTAPDRENIDLRKAIQYGWTHDDNKPCAVNPKGSTRRVASGFPGAGGTYRLDGSIGNDMRRGGDFQWTPGFTHYPWTGLAGFVPAAVMLHRAQYPAFEVADRAVLRTHEYMWHLRTATGNTDWFDEKRGSDVIPLVNHFYGTSFPTVQPVVMGKTIGYSDWTHARR